MEKLKKAVEEYFAAHPKAKEIHGTEDGFLFENKYFAIQHNTTLGEGKEVKTFTNKDGGAEESTGQIELTEDQKELLANGLVKENYKALVELVKVLKLEPENFKADTLIEALQDYKTNSELQA